MRWPGGKTKAGIPLLLLGVAVAVGFWQRAEHLRFERAATQSLVNRGRDITTSLGVVIRAQRRAGGIVSRDRVEAALTDLIRPGETEALAVLGATGETIASAGPPVGLTPEQLRTRSLIWREQTLVLLNPMDLGAGAAEDAPRTPPAIVVEDPRAFRTPPARRTPTPPSETKTAAAPASPAERTPFVRPSWMSREDYEAVIQKQGVQSLVIALSTAEMQRAVRDDVILRTLVTLLGLAAAGFSVLSIRHLRETSELQIRLVKAGEMNTHLSAMNFAAAGLAHETRNPLNLIRGLAQMIGREPGAPARLREHANTIIEEADRVTVQLNEFINYSKPREAHLAPVALASLAADVARTLQPDIEEKQVQLVIGTEAMTIEADAALLRQALFNLLLNAVQAVAPGGRVELSWRKEGEHGAVLEVSDDGPGVPPSERTAIFRPYVTMRPQGVGLGLAIVQQIISAHRWEITCTDHAPRGATFRISHLRIAATPAA